MSQYPPYDPQQSTGYSPQPPVDFGAKIKAPAICLIVIGSISVLFFLLSCAGNVMTLMNGVSSEPNPFTGEAQSEGEIIMGIVLTLVILIANVLVIFGGIQMLKQRGWGLAMTGAVVAVIPCLSPCCLLGIPFGIWALVVLLNQDVKASFS